MTGDKKLDCNCKWFITKEHARLLKRIYKKKEKMPYNLT